MHNFRFNSQFFHKASDFCKQFKDKKFFTDEFKENIKIQSKEVGTFLVGAGILKIAHDTYTENSEALTLENFSKKTSQALKVTIPSNFSQRSVCDAQESVIKSLNAVGSSQEYLSEARKMTSKMSPLFTIMPILATPVFALTTGLSGVDVINILGVLRVKEMVEMRPDIIPEHKKREYEKILKDIEKHIPKAATFDALKIFYRGQLVAVNRKLKESEKPQLNYKFPIFKMLSDNRLIPSKANLPIVSWILPTSFCISDLAAKDTQALTRDINKLIEFFHNIDAPCQDTQITEILKLQKEVKELEVILKNKTKILCQREAKIIVQDKDKIEARPQEEEKKD